MYVQMPGDVKRRRILLTQDTPTSRELELPYLLCSCALKQEDGSTSVDVSQPVAGGTPAGLSSLLGSLHRTAHSATDLDDHQISVFVFEDLSVRTQGRYTLEFRLGEACVDRFFFGGDFGRTASHIIFHRRPKSPRLAAVVSNAFDVVAWGDYPGLPTDGTPRSKALRRQAP